MSKRPRSPARAAARLAVGLSLSAIPPHGADDDGDDELLFARELWADARWADVALPDEPERRLIERLALRDERAFNQLVRAYERRVLALVLRMIGDRAEAEDLAQEVFVQVFKAIGGFRGESKLSTWIYRIAINLCKNRRKAREVRHASEHDEIDVIEQGATIGARAAVAQVERPDQMYEGMQVEQIVKLCIEELPAPFRECLVLCDVEELSYEEIGEITGLPPGTVKSRIFRARDQLKTCVEKKLGDRIR